MTDTPRVYIASLAHYNAGNLVGKWFDVDGDLETDVHKYIHSLSCHGQPCEEWAIHDYEGFGKYRVSEYHGLPELKEIAEAIEEHGEAITGYMENMGEVSPDIPAFEEAYSGEWDTEQDYAEQLFNEIYLSDVPQHLEAYIDYEKWTRDLFMCDYYSIDNPEGGVWVFRNC